MEIKRYSFIENTQEPREIVLLKSFPCKWGKCSFCDYIHDNSDDEALIDQVNSAVIEKISGNYGILQVINSGSCFELPRHTMCMLKEKVTQKGINKMYFEAHWLYRHRLAEIRDYFSLPIVFITGIETFDEHFRNSVLKKGIHFADVNEIKNYFQSICLMIGMLGQTQEMIDNDMSLLVKNFSHGTVNLYIDNSTSVKSDKQLQKWFIQKYSWLGRQTKFDYLINNTDFGVGGHD